MIYRGRSFTVVEQRKNEKKEKRRKRKEEQRELYNKII